MYCELHAASAFSFLDGASLPEDLAARAAELGLPAMAVCDRDGVYAAPRFHAAAKKAGVRALVGAEVTLEAGARLTLLAASPAGYKNLCRLLTAAAAGRPKGEPRASWELVASHAEGLHALTGGEEGPLRRAEDPAAELARLQELFPGRLHVELQRHRRREEERHLRAFVELAKARGLPMLATNGARACRPSDQEVLDVMTCIRLGVALDEAGTRLCANRERHLKGEAQMLSLFRDLPEAVHESGRLAERLGFTLADLGYRFPDYPLPPGHTPASYLKRLVDEAAPARFQPLTAAARAQLDKELAVIEKLQLAGYFLIVWDIVEFCRRERIMVQGRGSAANSAVCYALSITAVDPVKMDLLFERFLSEERGEWPDIDLDLPSGEQREKVIQYVYAKYGRAAAAMTANVITYRGRSAVREVAKALGCSLEQGDKLSRALGGLSSAELREDPQAVPRGLLAAGLDPAGARGKTLARVWRRMLALPRHLGQHSGGMVIAGGRLDEVVPLEPAAMPGRVVIQWDKEDCADLGLIKVDLLGLGMLAALETALPLIERHEGVKVDLARLPQDDPKVYAMLNAADTVGVFQLESRAQMASLPRHKPARFYDIVVQVAIIRPGPIVGGMVNPFFDRRNGRAPVTYPHPALEPILKRTLGVPLFQEQVLRMAMAVAGFSGGEAEELRRAMGFKRSEERMESIVERLRAGMEARGIGEKERGEIVKLITSFALYGFPESHSASFALIAYASAYLKAHHPAAFYASLLDAWPMGFYHPATLVQDAQRHGVEMLPIDADRSGWGCRWEAGGVRVGLRFVKGLSAASGRRIEAERSRAPFDGSPDLARRCGLREDELEKLADSGALSCFGLTRRQALWQVAKAARPAGPLFEDDRADDPSPLPEMTAPEETLADYRSTELTTGPHALAHWRGALKSRGVRCAAELPGLPDGSWVKTAGSVIVRQRPGTAKGFVFVTLEDETGFCQAIIRPDLFKRERAALTGSAGLVVEGRLQKQDGALSVRAHRVWPLDAAAAPSHDFH